MKDLFFSIRESRGFKTDSAACKWVCETMPEVFCPLGVNLTIQTVSTWRNQRDKTQNVDTIKKKGPKTKTPGEVPRSSKDNTKVPWGILCILASMILGQYSAGFPLSTTLLAPMVLAFFSTHDITWVPSISWYHKFLHKIGLSQSP